MAQTFTQSKAWYYYGWPWFIVGLLFITISACMLTIYLAIHFPDTPLHGQYVKDGLSIYENQAHDIGEMSDR